MKKEIRLAPNINIKTKPYWPTLKLILSSLIVFNFYLNLAHKEKLSYLIGIFDLTLIPMFVFIVAFITKNTTWKTLRLNLLSSIIIYLTFQTVDAIPLYFTGELSLKTYILSPQNGVWFFLATPVWQAIFLLLPPNAKSNNIILFLILLLSLVASYLSATYLIRISGFFSIILYFPFFVIAYFINNDNVISLRRKPVFNILITTTLALIVFYHQELINNFIKNVIKDNLISPLFIIYILKFLVSIALGISIVYIALSTEKYAKISNNALGVYLIHPIICFVFIRILTYFNIEFNLLIIILLTLSTISIALLLASNSIIHWFIDPKLNFNKSR